MKKLLAIVVVASVLTACNNDSDSKAATTDSPKVETPVTEAVKTADSAANQMMNKVDSLATKVADTVKKAAGKVVEKAKEAVKH